MKVCPHCGELLGESVKQCFNCYYDYSYGRVLTSEERSGRRENDEKEQQKALEEKEKALKLQEEQIKNNSLYQYKTVVLNDLPTGEIDSNALQMTLTQYAFDGWKLHSVFTNEIGKCATAIFVGFLGSSVNATIDQTILIFERCIRK